MMFSIGNNPFDKLYCWSHNKYEDWTQKVWRSKPHHVRCRICERLLRSDKDEYSPEQCGWRHFKKYGWICHSCDGHHYEHYTERDKLLDCFSSDVKHYWYPICDYNNGIFYNIVADKYVNIDFNKLCKAIGIKVDDKYEVVINRNRT